MRQLGLSNRHEKGQLIQCQCSLQIGWRLGHARFGPQSHALRNVLQVLLLAALFGGRHGKIVNVAGRQDAFDAAVLAENGLWSERGKGNKDESEPA